MGKYIAKRLGYMVVVALILSLLMFLVYTMIPYDRAVVEVDSYKASLKNNPNAGELYEKKLAEKKVKFSIEEDLAEAIWEDRPEFPAGKVMVLKEEITGKSFEKKREEVMEKVREEDAQSLLLTKLDDIMWLLNIRGCDVECNPVAMSYLYLSGDSTVLFIQRKALDATAEACFPRASR